jgi:hypothetical protein
MSLNTSTRYGRPIVRRYAGLVPTDTLDVASVVVESEAHDMRTQRIGLAGWSDQAQRPLDAPASVLDYLSFGPSFHQTFWELGQRGVTHLHFRVTPLTKDKPATLTATSSEDVPFRALTRRRGSCAARTFARRRA